MNARIPNGYIRVLQCDCIEGQHVAQVECGDFDVYVSLPAGIEFQGKLLGKTGWNSDSCKAYYKTGIPLGRRI